MTEPPTPPEASGDPPAEPLASKAPPTPVPPRWRWRPPVVDWRSKLRWFAAEIVVVVAGVLLALAANSWAGERADRAEEQAILRGLQADFETNRVRLDSTLAYNHRALEAGQRLLALMGSAPSDTEQVERLLGRTVDWEAYQPVTGRLDALLRSGRLGLIQSDSLQAALAGWETVLEDVRENEQIAVDMHYAHLAPYLWEHIQVRTVGYRAGYERVGSVSAFPHELTAVLSDPQFEDLVVERMLNVEALVEDGEDVHRAIDETLRLIGAELAR